MIEEFDWSKVDWSKISESYEAYQQFLAERVRNKKLYYRKLFDLTGKVAIITGGAGGLGTPTALALTDFGAKVVLVGRRAEKLRETLDMVREVGGEGIIVQADVTKEEDVKRMVQQVVDTYGKIDVLVTFAGINIPSNPAEEYPLDNWRTVIETNVTGVFLTCREVGRVMIKQRRGKIINVGSVRSFFGLPGNYVAYVTSKAAVIGLTRQLATEWAKYNIQVNAIAPTVVLTPLTAHIPKNPQLAQTMKPRILLGRWAVPDDIVGAIVFFASDASNFVTGQVLLIDGGVTAWA
ncbi:MAG: SDR family oxidoreductase [Thermosphaera sp.]